MIRPMVLVGTFILMVLNMKVNGRKINNMAKELKHGLMVRAMKVITWKAKRTALVSLSGLMVQHMTDNS